MEQLLDHNVGVNKKFNFLYYFDLNKMICLNPDGLKNWEYTSKGQYVYDFALDQKVGLIFVISNGYVECLSMVSGNLVWSITRLNNWTNGIMTISNKNGYIYDRVFVSGASRFNVYDYNGNHVLGKQYNGGKMQYSDKEDVLVLQVSRNSYALSKDINQLKMSPSSYISRNFVLEKKTNEMYIFTNAGLRKSTPMTLDSPVLVGTQLSYDAQDTTTQTVDDEGFIYITRVINSTNTLIKIDKNTGVQVYTKVIRRFSIDNGAPTMTQDAEYLYQQVSSVESDGDIYKISKLDGEIVSKYNLSLRYSKLVHTYDSLT
ncbi:hypothetical protein MKY34_16705 [Sporosarcina sp. FSL K6-1522]|uniref:hypothetical protein n=1 Tax=Sporosarcina sp. FSL K6-1522 TaxID=2921554 RepID=UPI003159F34E